MSADQRSNPGPAEVATGLALRRAFDLSFAEPAAVDRRDDRTALVIINLPVGRHALRVLELVAVARARVLTPVPSRAPGLLGLTGIRGSIVPVYSLATVLGHPAPSDRSDPPGWLAVGRQGHEMAALAFDGLEEYREVSRAAFRPVPGDGPRAGGEQIREAVSLEGGTALVVEMAGVLAALRRRATEVGERGKER